MRWLISCRRSSQTLTFRKDTYLVIRLKASLPLRTCSCAIATRLGPWAPFEAGLIAQIFVIEAATGRTHLEANAASQTKPCRQTVTYPEKDASHQADSGNSYTCSHNCI